MLPSILVLLKRCVRRPLGWRLPPGLRELERGEKDAQLLMVENRGDTGKRETRKQQKRPCLGVRVFSV